MGDSEAQPDFQIVKREEALISTTSTNAAYAIIEVCDTTYCYNSTTKLELYAATGIPELWLVNLALLQVEIHRKPSKTLRTYASKVVVGVGGRLSLENFHIIFSVDDFFLLLRDQDLQVRFLDYCVVTSTPARQSTQTYRV